MSATPWQGRAARLRARVQPLLVQAQDRWRNLSGRERKQIAAMVAVVAMAAVWLLLTKPALDTLQYWGNELPRLRSQAAALKDVLADAGGPGTAARGASGPPAARLRASLDAAGLAGGYQLREAGATWQIEFERTADVSRVMAWLLDAPASLGMAVRQVTLQRPDDGASSEPKNRLRASATVAVQEQPGNGT